MSFNTSNASQNFLNDGEQLKYLIKAGFDPDKKCQYDSLALKLRFNKLVLSIRQFMLENNEQECPDIFHHMKMLREVIDVLGITMDINFGRASEIDLRNIATPRAKSTPKQLANAKKLNTPRIVVSNATGDEQLQQSLYRTAIGEQNLQLPSHQRMFKAVRNLEKTLNLLSSPASVSPRTLSNVVKKPCRCARKGLQFGTK